MSKQPWLSLKKKKKKKQNKHFWLLVTLASFFTILYTPFRLDRLWWPQPSNDTTTTTTTTTKKDNFTCFFCCKKKREKLSLFFLVFIIISSCFVSCLSSIRLHVDGDIFFFFLSFVEENTIKEKETTTKPNGCCVLHSSHFQLMHEMSFPNFFSFSFKSSDVI